MGNKHSRRKMEKHYHAIRAEDKIAQSTYGVVSRCFRKSDRREFAVKMITKRFLTGRELVGVQDEIRIMKLVKHAHVVNLCDVFEDSSRVKIVMELCEGGDLFSQMAACRGHKFSEAVSAQLTFTIANVILYLHENNIVHRDLKPENILFTKDGILKVSDFGLAHFAKTSPEQHYMNTSCGTPHYAAPEVLSGDLYGPQCDIWSLGVIAYIMICGYQPFHSESIAEVYNLILTGSYRFDSPHWDHISKDAKNFVSRLLVVNPNHRINLKDLLKHPWIVHHVNSQQMAQKSDAYFSEIAQFLYRDGSVSSDRSSTVKSHPSAMEPTQQQMKAVSEQMKVNYHIADTPLRQPQKTRVNHGRTNSRDSRSSRGITPPIPNGSTASNGSIGNQHDDYKMAPPKPKMGSVTHSSNGGYSNTTSNHSAPASIDENGYNISPPINQNVTSNASNSSSGSDSSSSGAGGVGGSNPRLVSYKFDQTNSGATTTTETKPTTEAPFSHLDGFQNVTIADDGTSELQQNADLTAQMTAMLRSYNQ